MADNNEPRGTVRLVYAGVRLGNKNRLKQTFHKVEGTGAFEAEPRVYSSIKGLGRPGAIYDVECDANKDSTIYSGTLRYIGVWDDEAQVVEWQARHDATQAADRARRRHNREAKRNFVEEQLGPIRKAYWKCSGLERAALLAQVVGYITGRLPEGRGGK
jgi:hypothetical protein